MHDPDTMLNYLEVLLKESNFTKAAKRLYISQPYLTQLIKRIENELGAVIVNRQKTPFTLTEAGQIYYQYLENVSNQRQYLNTQLQRFTDDNTETIRIAILESLGTFLLPEILPAYLKDHPAVRVQIVEGFPHDSEERILSNQADCYIGQTPETLNQGITAYINGGESYYIVIPANSSYFIPNEFILSRDTYDLKDLLQEPFVLSSTESAIRRQVSGLFQNYRIVPKIRMTSNSVITATNLAIHGLGLGISAASIIKRVQRTPINLYPIDPEMMKITYFIGIKKGQTPTPALQDLISAFQKADLQAAIN